MQAIGRTSEHGTNGSSASAPYPYPGLVSSFKPYSFDQSDLEAVHASGDGRQPFAVMGSQVVLGPDEASQGTPGAPCRRYLWGTALPLDRAHSDLIVLKQLLTGHQNRAVYSLLQDSWGRAHAFHKRYEEQKRAQLKAKLADDQLSGDVDAILAAVHGLDVDMSPLVDEVCGSVSRGGEQQRQDRLRCEE